MPTSERHRARLQALQMLYQRDVTGQCIARILADETYSIEDGVPDEFSRRIVTGVEAVIEELDQVIGDISEHWVVSRMPPVDRNILRIATWEILFNADVPKSVAINEAVELAKVYGGEDSSKFVNGVLGRVAERHRSEE